MTRHATYLSGDLNPGHRSTRRWDSSLAILALLESEPKTASQLFRLLNPGVRRGWVLTPAGWKRRLLNVRVDKRVLMRHLRYLLRDGLIGVRPQLKILERDQDSTTWLIKYYRLRRGQGGATPPRSPLLRPYHVSKIHNPLPGQDGMLRFIQWLRDPQPR